MKIERFFIQRRIEALIADAKDNSLFAVRVFDSYSDIELEYYLTAAVMGDFIPVKVRNRAIEAQVILTASIFRLP